MWGCVLANVLRYISPKLNYWQQTAIKTHDKYIPVTIKWCILRVQMKEWPPICMVGANIFNKQSGAANKGWPSEWGVERGASNSSPQKITMLQIYMWKTEGWNSPWAAMQTPIMRYGGAPTPTQEEKALRLQTGTELHIPTRGTEPTFLGSKRQMLPSAHKVWWTWWENGGFLVNLQDQIRERFTVPYIR